MTFGDKLVMCRKKSHMSQEQVADKLGVSRQAVSRWEAEGTMPDAYNLKKLGELFGVSVDYLLLDDAGKTDNEGKMEEEGKAEREAEENKQEEKVEPHKGAGWKHWMPVFLIICGMAGIAVLWVCSTQIEAIDMRPLVRSDELQLDTDGRIQDVELYVPKKVYSFFPFLSYYHLHTIAGVFAAMFLGGAFWLILIGGCERKSYRKG